MLKGESILGYRQGQELLSKPGRGKNTWEQGRKETLGGFLLEEERMG